MSIHFNESLPWFGPSKHLSAHPSKQQRPLFGQSENEEILSTERWITKLWSWWGRVGWADFAFDKLSVLVDITVPKMPHKKRKHMRHYTREAKKNHETSRIVWKETWKSPVSVCPGLQQLEGGAPWQAVAVSEGAGQDEDPPSPSPPTPVDTEI